MKRPSVVGAMNELPVIRRGLSLLLTLPKVTSVALPTQQGT